MFLCQYCGKDRGGCECTWRTIPMQPIVSQILEDLTDRMGLKHEWNRVPLDIQQEIISTWNGIVSNALKKKGK